MGSLRRKLGGKYADYEDLKAKASRYGEEREAAKAEAKKLVPARGGRFGRGGRARPCRRPIPACAACGDDCA